MSPKNRVTSVLVLMMVLSLILAACGQATPVVETVIVPGQEVVITATPGPAQNPYLGSNQLDGNGVPADFFTDVHIRKAFSYCFDWDTLIADVYNGEAVQAITLPLPGMPGYDLTATHYTFDLA